MTISPLPWTFWSRLEFPMVFGPSGKDYAENRNEHGGKFRSRCFSPIPLAQRALVIEALSSSS